MLRAILFLFCFLTLPPPAAAQDARLVRDFSVERAKDPTLRGRVEGIYDRVYGGVRGATLAHADAPAAVQLYFGMRPQFRRLSMDFTYTRGFGGACCGVIAVDLRHPLGERADFTARLALDPAAETARSEARAELRLSRQTSLEAGLGGALTADGGEETSWNLGASRKLAAQTDLSLRYAGATAAPDRTALTLAIRF